MIELQFLHKDRGFDVWTVLDNSEEVADLAVKLVNLEVLRIRHIEHFGGPGAFGASKLRELQQAIKREYPTVQEVEGFRQSGTRSAKLGRAREVRRRI